jgi:hypothetical protein
LQTRAGGGVATQGLGKVLMERQRLVSRMGKALRIMLAASAATACLPLAATAQQTQPPPSDGPIGPPQLRDFQLEPRQRIVTQPRPTPQPTPTQAQPEPAAQPPAERNAQQQPRADAPRSAPATPRAPVRSAPPAAGTAPAPSPTPGAANDVPAALPAPADLPSAGAAPAPAPSPLPVSAAPDGAPAPVDPAQGDGLPLWMILLGGLGLGVVGYALFTRRRAAQRRALALPAPAMAARPQPQAPRVPRPDPVPRPWLDIELTPERTTADPDESTVEFELRIHNKGGSIAANIRLQAKLFCSTPDQDKQIAGFHRMQPGEHRTLDIPDIPAGQELRLKGRVDIQRDQIKVLRVDGRLLFIPLVAVNAFYGWGSGRTGQTSKSFLVGRETAEATDKMAPFRMDLGPRVYRTVGQRPYAVERRV